MVIILIILLLIMSVVIVKILLMWKQLQSCNQRPLDIKTFDGSDSPYHPAVLSFKDGWNGYKYWMAETPFSPKAQPYPDRFECPTIHVSNDGINWTHLGDELKPIDTTKNIINMLIVIILIYFFSCFFSILYIFCFLLILKFQALLL